MAGKEVFMVKMYNMKKHEIPVKNDPNVTVIPEGKIVVKKDFFMIHREGDCSKHEKLEIYFKEIIDEIRECENCKNKKIEIYRTT